MKITIDTEHETIATDDIMYSFRFFQSLDTHGLGPRKPFAIVERKGDGAVTIEELSRERAMELFDALDAEKERIWNNIAESAPVVPDGGWRAQQCPAYTGGDSGARCQVMAPVTDQPHVHVIASGMKDAYPQLPIGWRHSLVGEA